MTTYLEIDEAELTAMWPTEWREYAANVMGIPVNSIEHVTVFNDNGLPTMVVTEA